MIGFEQGFDDTENAARSIAGSAANVAKSAKALERAAKIGNISAVRRAQTELASALSALSQEGQNAANAWPFQPDEEQSYLKDHFAGELRQVAATQGLDMHEHDERLIAHPSILRVLPSSRAVRIDRKQASTIRPSYLVSELLKKQKTAARSGGRSILEAMYKAYQMLVGGLSPLNRLEADLPQAVPLSRIYDALTLMPGTGRDYSRTEFALDLYGLETEGPRETRSGAQVHFYGGRQSNIALVAPDGKIITYYNVAFTEAGNG